MAEWNVVGKTPFDPVQHAVDFFSSNGWEPHQVAGIVGNLSHESNLNPDSVGDRGASVGVAQWNKERRKGLIDFARQKGETRPSFQTQLEYVQYELDGSEKAAAERLRSAKSAAEATKIFSEQYERPGNPMMGSRLSRAKKVFMNLLTPSEAQAAEPTWNVTRKAPVSEWTAVRKVPLGEMSAPSAQAQPAAQAQPMQQQEPGFPETFGFDAAVGPEMARATAPLARPLYEFGGLVGGAAAGTPAGPLGAVTGAGLGYGAGRQLANVQEEYAGLRTRPQTGEALLNAAGDIATGVAMESGGAVAGKLIGETLKAGGAVARPVLGRLSGTGTGAVEEALKSGEATGMTKNPFRSLTDFDRAMRGEITGEEVVQNAKTALSSIKEQRGSEYVGRLEKIKVNPQRLDALKKHVDKTAEDLISSDKYQIQPSYNNKGELEFDFSKSTLVEGQPVVKRALEDVFTWQDTSAKGLDVLKKRLSTYVDQVKRGTPAESFLVKLEKSLDIGLKREVPGYHEMTKGYSEATALIKDVEAGLMMRKQGMTGRIVSDQTLRRLTSAMRDNFTLRRDLVNALSVQGGEDIAGQVAGNAMSQVLPRGLAGTGPVIVGEAAIAHFVNPSFWPVLAASSPRAQGEFLRLFGKGLAEARGLSGAAGRMASYGLMDDLNPLTSNRYESR